LLDLVAQETPHLQAQAKEITAVLQQQVQIMAVVAVVVLVLLEVLEAQQLAGLVAQEQHLLIAVHQ
jgi:hypothetical protein